MLICSFFWGKCCTTAWAWVDAWGAITTVNGSSTRSGFRDKSGFSHQMLSPFRAFTSGWLSPRIPQLEGGTRVAEALTYWQARRWYLRIKSGRAPPKSDKPTRAAKAFTLKCLVFISPRRLLLRHKRQPPSVVIAARMALSVERHPAFEAVDVAGWRLKGSFLSFFFFWFKSWEEKKRWGRCGSLQVQRQHWVPSGRPRLDAIHTHTLKKMLESTAETATSGSVFQAPKVERLLAMQIHAVLQRG